MSPGSAVHSPTSSVNPTAPSVQSSVCRSSKPPSAAPPLSVPPPPSCPSLPVSSRSLWALGYLVLPTLPPGVS